MWVRPPLPTTCQNKVRLPTRGLLLGCSHCCIFLSFHSSHNFCFRWFGMGDGLVGPLPCSSRPLLVSPHCLVPFCWSSASGLNSASSVMSKVRLGRWERHRHGGIHHLAIAQPLEVPPPGKHPCSTRWPERSPSFWGVYSLIPSGSLFP